MDGVKAAEADSNQASAPNHLIGETFLMTFQASRRGATQEASAMIG